MNNLIVYGSLHGSSERYAKALARELDAPVMSFEDFQIEEKEPFRLIYVGGLYAGGVRGLKKTLKKVAPDQLGELVIASVGLSSVDNPEDIANRRKSITSQVSEQFHNRLHLFHLRGNINYAKLSLLHRLMMFMVKRNAERNIDASEENRTLVETYGKEVNFYDEKYLEPVIHHTKS